MHSLSWDLKKFDKFRWFPTGKANGPTLIVGKNKFLGLESAKYTTLSKIIHSPLTPAPIWAHLSIKLGLTSTESEKFSANSKKLPCSMLCRRTQHLSTVDKHTRRGAVCHEAGVVLRHGPPEYFQNVYLHCLKQRISLSWKTQDKCKMWSYLKNCFVFVKKILHFFFIYHHKSN